MNPGSLSTDRLKDFDFASHNAETKAMWAGYHAGKPTRTPIFVGTNTRYFIFNKAANPDGIDFQRFSEDPDLMFDTQLRFARWGRFNLMQDFEMGLPEKWGVAPDFQNYYEAAWFGCPVEYMAGQVPDTTPAFEDCPERIMEKGLPDPFGGLFAKVLRYAEHYQERAAKETYLGRPIQANFPWCGQGTDGPFTVACNVFGPTFVCSAMLEEPERFHKLLDFITTATIARMTAWRKLAKTPIPQDGFGFADDSIALISTPSYVEHILPYHRRLIDALATDKPRSIHLCGDATRHFPTLQKELNIQSFDTGFPVDFGALRRTLGPTVRISGGPHVDLLLNATPDQVRAETRRILASGILEGGLFALREGNNLAPYTPLANIEAMYETGRQYGFVPSTGAL